MKGLVKRSDLANVCHIIQALEKIDLGERITLEFRTQFRISGSSFAQTCEAITYTPGSATFSFGLLIKLVQLLRTLQGDSLLIEARDFKLFFGPTEIDLRSDAAPANVDETVAAAIKLNILELQKKHGCTGNAEEMEDHPSDTSKPRVEHLANRIWQSSLPLRILGITEYDIGRLVMEKCSLRSIPTPSEYTPRTTDSDLVRDYEDAVFDWYIEEFMSVVHKIEMDKKDYFVGPLEKPTRAYQCPFCETPVDRDVRCKHFAFVYDTAFGDYREVHEAFRNQLATLVHPQAKKRLPDPHLSMPPPEELETLLPDKSFKLIHEQVDGYSNYNSPVIFGFFMGGA